MKNKFPEYYRPNSEELSSLFDECLFVFDTNALLDIFRLGEELAKKVIDLIKDFHDRIVIPYHVAEEFHKDYLEAICSELSIGQDAVRLLDNTKSTQLLDKEFIGKIPRCFRKDFLKELDALLVKYKNLQSKRNDYLNKQKETGELLRSIAELLGDVMLTGFTDAEIDNISKEGAERYSSEIPPGYKDSIKKVNKYGDFIIWKEILKVASERQKSVIFISNDLKEDWIEIKYGMKCGPRIELIREFQKEVQGKTFYSYTLERFISYANEKKQSLKNKEMEFIKVILKDRVDNLPTLKLQDDDILLKVDTNHAGTVSENVSNKKGVLVNQSAASMKASDVHDTTESDN